MHQRLYALRPWSVEPRIEAVRHYISEVKNGLFSRVVDTVNAHEPDPHRPAGVSSGVERLCRSWISVSHGRDTQFLLSTLCCSAQLNRLRTACLAAAQVTPATSERLIIGVIVSQTMT